jgi:hypothetical protein
MIATLLTQTLRQIYGLRDTDTKLVPCWNVGIAAFYRVNASISSATWRNGSSDVTESIHGVMRSPVQRTNQRSTRVGRL